MPEHEPRPTHHRDNNAPEHPPGPFWDSDEVVGEVRFPDYTAPLSLKTHLSEERYRHYSHDHEIVRLKSHRGLRHYLLARPYVLEPTIALTVDLFSRRHPNGAIGELVGGAVTDRRPVDIGSAQAWLYPQEQTLVLWECYLFDRFRAADPLADANLHTLWEGVEGVLLDRFPHAQRLVTPSWEPQYDREQWQAFLQSRGFARANGRAFGKQVGHSPSR